MVSAGWGDPAYGKSDPAVAGRASAEDPAKKDHHPRGGYTMASTLSRLNPAGLLFVGLLEVHRL